MQCSLTNDGKLVLQPREERSTPLTPLTPICLLDSASGPVTICASLTPRACIGDVFHPVLAVALGSCSMIYKFFLFLFFFFSLSVIDTLDKK